MKEIKIKEVENGYIVSFAGYSSKNGEYAYRGMDGLLMLEIIGEQVWKKKVKIEEK